MINQTSPESFGVVFGACAYFVEPCTMSMNHVPVSDVVIDIRAIVALCVAFVTEFMQRQNLFVAFARR
jgi:hypothetical protein